MNKIILLFRTSIRRVISTFMILFFFSGCATPPSKISARYVSPLQYQSYTCDQISEELLRVNRKIIDISGVQKKEATKDAWAMGVGLVLFWPALFFLIGTDKKEELAGLKGEYEALESAAIKKECKIAAELEGARIQREKYEEELKKKKQSKPSGTGIQENL